jgi:hypothetical protein
MTHPSIERVEVPAFDAARIRALNNYAAIEVSLGMLLSAIIGVKPPIGLTIIFRIANTRSRYAIISDLIARSANAECRPFWNGAESRLGALDSIRNQIVHWVSVFDHGNIGGSDPTAPEDKRIAMTPGARMGQALSAENELTITKLERFSTDASSIRWPLVMFSSYLGGHFSEPERASLRQIFLKPLDDQTEAALQSALFSKAPGPPPRP